MDQVIVLNSDGFFEVKSLTLAVEHNEKIMYKYTKTWFPEKIIINAWYSAEIYDPHSSFKLPEDLIKSLQEMAKKSGVVIETNKREYSRITIFLEEIPINVFEMDNIDLHFITNLCNEYNNFNEKWKFNDLLALVRLLKLRLEERDNLLSGIATIFKDWDKENMLKPMTEKYYPDFFTNIMEEGYKKEENFLDFVKIRKSID